MPVLLQLGDWRWLAIETNGKGTRLHPEIVRSRVADNWSATVGRPSPDRFSPFLVSRDSFSKLDAKLLRMAFVFSLLADCSFSMVKFFAPDERALSNILGIAFFIMFQVVLIHRHTRTSETDDKPGKIHKFLLLPVAGFSAALFGGNVIEPTLDNITAVIVVVYGIFVITSLIVGILAPRNSYFPAANAKLIRWGMVAFFFGDVLVGLALITSEDHSTVQAVAEIANNFVWWVYVPAQLMLILGTKKGHFFFSEEMS
jgi:hypothetical protein